MEYLVNDIEGLIKASNSLVFRDICENNSVSLTNIRGNKFSISTNKELEKLLHEGLISIEVDINFYTNYIKDIKTKFKYMGIGDCDLSSIYQAEKDNLCLVTSNQTIMEICNEIGVVTISTGAFNQKMVLNSLKENKY